MVVGNHDSGTSGLRTFLRVTRARHALHDKRHPCRLHELLEFPCCLRAHRQPEDIVVPAGGIEGMVRIHSDSNASDLHSMFHLTEDLPVVGVRLYDLYRLRTCGDDAFEFRVLPHSDPMNSIRKGGTLAIDCHSVRRIMEVGKSCGHYRRIEFMPEQFHPCRRNIRVYISGLQQK